MEIGIEYYRAVGHSDASRYNLQSELKPLQVADESVIRLGRAIDDQLASLNIEYDQKRGSVSRPSSEGISPVS